MLAAGNVYTSLKVAIIDGGSITAALLGFGIFAAFGRSGRHALQRAREQHHADHRVVGGGHGLRDRRRRSDPALGADGHRLSATALVAFGAAVGMLGVFVAALLRRRLIVEEALPFPTGMATGEVIETIFGARQAAVRRIGCC